MVEQSPLTHTYSAPAVTAAVVTWVPGSKTEQRGVLRGQDGPLPVEALVRVVGQREGRDDELAGHGAELLAKPLHVLADALVPAQHKEASTLLKPRVRTSWCRVQ